jgi:hypothetical protein
VLLTHIQPRKTNKQDIQDKATRRKKEGGKERRYKEKKIVKDEEIVKEISPRTMPNFLSLSSSFF